MAQVGESGGDRESNVELNLVPFIDLMSVCITFLLITAVWSQVSMIQIGSSIYGRKTEGAADPTPPKENIVLRIDVKQFGYSLLYGQRTIEIAKTKMGEYDTESLLYELLRVKADRPQKEDAVITVQNDLNYDSLIQGMDQVLAAGFPQISVASSGVE